MSGPPRSTGGRRVDLHSHTHFSDGQMSPEELIDYAVSRNVVALAITDHDTIEALPRARAAASGRLELVPGIEISSAMDGFDLHILGYYIDDSHPGLLERLAGFRDERRRRALAIIERLHELGVPVDADEILAAAGPGVVGRPHVAAALVRAGHVETFDAAFQRYLGIKGQAFVPRPAFRPEEAIEHIATAGGLAVLAHPGSWLPESVVEMLAAAGLRGVEVWHPQHGVSTVQRYRALARRLSLLETGGSDFHGTHRGVDLGDMPVPESAVAALTAAHAAR